MKLNSEQARQLQEKLAAQKDPKEAEKIVREFGIDLSAENMEEILDKVSGGVQTLSDDALEHISGGGNADIPQYDIIRDYYLQKGPNPAFVLCIYYIPSPICYEIIQVIEEDAKKNGHDFSRPDGYQ